MIPKSVAGIGFSSIISSGSNGIARANFPCGSDFRIVSMGDWMRLDWLAWSHDAYSCQKCIVTIFT